MKKKKTSTSREKKERPPGEKGNRSTREKKVSAAKSHNNGVGGGLLGRETPNGLGRNPTQKKKRSSPQVRTHPTMDTSKKIGPPP